MGGPLLLRRRDLRPLLADASQIEDAFRAVEAAILAQARGEAGVAAYLRLPQEGERGAMSVYATAPRLGLTLRTFPYPGSPDPPDGHLMLLFDAASGGLQALLASDDLNALRTSVPAGVGARALAPPGAQQVGMVGSGRQARAVLRALRHALPRLAEVRVWSPTRAHRERYAAEMGESLDLPVEAVGSAGEAARDADVVVLAGLGPRPLVEAREVRSGALVVSLSHLAPPDLVAQADCVVPSLTRPRALALRPAADGTPAPVPIPEHARPLADVLLGQAPRRRRPGETVVYELGGMYAWDAPIVRWAYDWAVARGVGQRLDLEG